MLARLDHKDDVRSIAPGSLPGWMRTRWARPKLGGKHGWLDVDALPTLYTSGGSKLPREATIAVVRILTHTTGSRCHDDVAEVRSYVHPVAMRRLVEALIDQWVVAHMRWRNWLPTGSVPPSSQVRLQTQWVPFTHRLFNDRHSVEHVTSLCLYGLDELDGDEYPARVFPVFVPDTLALLTTLRDAGEFGEATLRVLSHGSHLRQDARAALRLDNPHKPNRWRTLDLCAETPMSFDAQVDAIDSLGFASGAREMLDDEGERRWVGVDLLELLEHDDARTLHDHATHSLLTAGALIRYLFDQTRLELERHRDENLPWSPDQWTRTFLGHPYMTLFARRVIWYDRTSERLFRVADDLELTDSHDEPLTLDDDALVEVATNQRIGAPELSRWTSLFADYEIMNPLDQLDGRTAREDA